MISKPLAELIEFINGLETLPVRLTKIQSWIEEKGIQGRMQFFETPIPSSVSRGFFRQFENLTPQANPRYYSRIYFSAGETPIWRRFVQCKEMMHVFDLPKNQTSEKDQVIGVIKNLYNFGFSLDELERRSPDEIADKTAILSALLVLVPINPLRAEVLRKIQETEITLFQAAEVFEIPDYYADFVFTSFFEEAAESFLK